MFASQSLSCINNIRTALINAQKGNQSVAAYFAAMRGLADELAAAGKPIQDDELIFYLLHGLDMDYQPLVSALDARVTPVSLDELYAMLSNFDQRVAQYHSAGGGFKSSANATTRGRGGYSSRHRGPPRVKGKHSSGNTNNSGSRGGRPTSTNNKGRRGGSCRSRPDVVRC